jgi:hypothetical protein
LKEYEANPSQWPGIVRILPIGTKLRFVQAYNRGALDWSLYNLHIRAITDDNPKVLVELACVSRPASGGTRWLRDEQWVRAS